MSESNWGFGDPSQGDQFKNAEHLGELVAFVSPSRVMVTTVHGEQESTVCRYIVVLDGPDKGTVFDNSIVFGNLGRDAWSNGSHKVVIGRVAQGQAKPGQSAPFILQPAEADERQVAGKWFDENAAVNPAGEIVIG